MGSSEASGRRTGYQAPGPWFTPLAQPVPATGQAGLSDSLDGLDPGGLDGFGEGGEVALVLLGVAL